MRCRPLLRAASVSHDGSCVDEVPDVVRGIVGGGLLAAVLVLVDALRMIGVVDLARLRVNLMSASFHDGAAEQRGPAADVTTTWPPGIGIEPQPAQQQEHLRGWQRSQGPPPPMACVPARHAGHLGRNRMALRSRGNRAASPDVHRSPCAPLANCLACAGELVTSVPSGRVALYQSRRGVRGTLVPLAMKAEVLPRTARVRDCADLCRHIGHRFRQMRS